MGTKEIPENLAKSNKNLSHSVKKETSTFIYTFSY